MTKQAHSHSKGNRQTKLNLRKVYFTIIFLLVLSAIVIFILNFSSKTKPRTQTFSNENYGYEISYPKAWQKTEDISAPCPDLSETGWGNTVDFSKEGYVQADKRFDAPAFSVRAIPLGSDKTYWNSTDNVEELAKNIGGCFIYSKTSLPMKNLHEEIVKTIDGKEMFVATATWTDTENHMDTFGGCGYVVANKYIYTLIWKDDRGEYNPELKKIFSTIKFFRPGISICKEKLK